MLKDFADRETLNVMEGIFLIGFGLGLIIGMLVACWVIL